jgi:hypothetical protein
MFSRVAHRITAFACVAQLTAIAACGQGLHRLAGIDHGCARDRCCASSPVAGCFPRTRDCCFASGGGAHDGVQQPSAETRHERLAAAPHLCTICRVLAQAAQVVWEADAHCVSVTPGAILAAPAADPVVQHTFVRYSPRGPPA